MSSFQPLFQSLDIILPEAAQPFLEEAFTHRSSLNEKQGITTHNERLEFLGDAVLELVTTEFLFRNYNLPEGDLTNYRSALVKRSHLAEVARRLKLGKHLRLSAGEARSGGAEKEYLLANTLEALIGAMHLGVGADEARKFIEKYILVDLPDILERGEERDAKSELQELTQGKFSITPEYTVIAESGKDHEKTFMLGVMLGTVQAGKGSGKSKKEAQLAAAADALGSQKKWKGKLS